MPANRSRTERWRECLRQIQQREGGIELTLPNPTGGPNLMWRCRLLRMTDEELVVEMPGAAGQSVELTSGLDVVCVIALGQNRWMFHSKTRGSVSLAARGRGPNLGLRLTAPTEVERCQRRQFYRISTASIELPLVECWPVLDPASVRMAEIANRSLVNACENGSDFNSHPGSDGTGDIESSLVLPEVGPRFTGRLANISGGGLGLVFEGDEAAAVDQSRLVWLRVDLRPTLAAPIGLTARLSHTHMDSGQRVYAGLAFEFQFNPSHRGFVLEQIGRFVNRTRLRAAAA